MNSIKLINYANKILTIFSPSLPLHALIKSSSDPLGACSIMKYKFFSSKAVVRRLIICEFLSLSELSNTLSLSTLFSFPNSVIRYMFTDLIATYCFVSLSIARLTVPNAPSPMHYMIVYLSSLLGFFS